MSGGMLGTGRLPPIWFERFDRSRAAIAPSLRFPAAGALMREADERRREIDEGRVGWPPTALPNVPAFTPTSLGCFVTLPSAIAHLGRVVETIGGLPAAERDRLSALEVHQFFHTTLWKHYGRRVYVLDPVTCELLANTTLPALPIGEVAVPLPAFYILFPPRWLSFRAADDPVPQAAEGLSVIVSDCVFPSGPERHMSLLLTGSSGGDGTGDDPALYTSLYLSPSARLVDVRLDSVLGGTVPGGEDMDVRLPRAVLGLILYLQSAHPLIRSVPAPTPVDVSALRNPAKRRRAERANERTSRLSYFYVGGERPERLSGAAGDGASGRRLDHQVWVTGHWKEQPYGPGHELRRPQWIKPYLKGPDMAESAQLRVGRVRQAEGGDRV